MTDMDHIEAFSKKKCKCTKKLYCPICERWNHSTLQCFKNRLNYKLNKTLEALDEMFHKMKMEMRGRHNPFGEYEEMRQKRNPLGEYEVKVRH